MQKSDVLATCITRFTTIFAGLITSILTARFLGPEGRGNYFFVITLAVILSQFCNFGLQSSNTYLVTQQPNLMGKLTANSFWISCVVGIGITLLTIFVWYSLHQSLPSGMFFTIILAPTTLFYLLGTNLLIGLNQIKLFNLFQFGSNVLPIFGILIAAQLSLESKSFIFMSALCWLLTSLSLLAVLLKYTHLNFSFDWKVFETGFKFAAKAYLTTLIGYLVLKGNIFLLKHYCSDQVLGYFSIASQINDVLILLPSSIGLLLFPYLVRNYANRWAETKKSLFTIIFLMLICCLLAAILVKPFVIIVFGKPFAPAIPILLAMLPGTFFLALTTIISQYLAATGYPKELIYIWGVTLIIMSLSSWVLIPKLGGIGAAIALSIAYFFLFGMISGFTYLYNKPLKYNISQNHFKSV